MAAKPPGEGGLTRRRQSLTTTRPHPPLRGIFSRREKGWHSPFRVLTSVSHEPLHARSFKRPVGTDAAHGSSSMLAGAVGLYAFLPVAPLPQVDYPDDLRSSASAPRAQVLQTMAVGRRDSARATVRASIAGVTEMTSSSYLGSDQSITLQFDLNRNIDGCCPATSQAAINAARSRPALPTCPAIPDVSQGQPGRLAGSSFITSHELGHVQRRAQHVRRGLDRFSQQKLSLKCQRRRAGDCRRRQLAHRPCASTLNPTCA